MKLKTLLVRGLPKSRIEYFFMLVILQNFVKELSFAGKAVKKPAHECNVALRIRFFFPGDGYSMGGPTETWLIYGKRRA